MSIFLLFDEPWIVKHTIENICNPWSSVQSSWLQVQRSGFGSQCYQILGEVVGLKRGPLSLVGTLEELLGRKSSGSGIKKTENTALGNRHADHAALTSPTSGGHSVGIVFSPTQTTEFSLVSIACNFSVIAVRSSKSTLPTDRVFM
jgi:hypothetical protein